MRQDNLAATVCIPGWTATVRPKVSYTNKLKAAQMKQFTLRGELSAYEEDHCVPLALGGHPTDPKNLHPQPWNGKCGAKVKDVLESRLHRELCAGKITLKQAQERVHHWCD